MRTRAFALCILLGVGGACTPDISQQAHPRPADSPAAPSADLASQDRDFLERAANGTNAEIAIGRLVEGRAKDAAVLRYGRMMVGDHGAIRNRLTGVAAERSIAIPESLGEHQQGFDRLVDLKGEAFDQKFMQTMIDDHHAAVELYRSEASGGVDPAIRALAARTLPAIEAHLETALSFSAIAATPQEQRDDRSIIDETASLTTASVSIPDRRVPTRRPAPR